MAEDKRLVGVDKATQAALLRVVEAGKNSGEEKAVWDAAVRLFWK